MEKDLNSPPMEGCQRLADGVDYTLATEHTRVKNKILTYIKGAPIKRNFISNLPYNFKLKSIARSNRKAGIFSEVVFWQQVHRGLFHKIDFDRQRIIGNYIVDFYVKTLGLVIEIDGDSHDLKSKEDNIRQEFLERLGLKVYRIKDKEVLTNLKKVMEELERYILEQFGC